MFLNADFMVQCVMAILFVISLASWSIMIEKTFVLWKVRKAVGSFKRMAPQIDEAGEKFSVSSGIVRHVIETGLAESRDDLGDEGRADYRARVERAMRSVLAGWLDAAGARTTFLATAGSISPFIGLFGTVWGIMHSFIGIAATGDTSLRVVAPGIAEALLATAMGLIAAIPAVIAYNKIRSALRNSGREASIAVGLAGNRLARIHFAQSRECRSCLDPHPEPSDSMLHLDYGFGIPESYRESRQ
jgi:biopolymer transport protein ExbB/TolQ